jgi:hypothetical protein
LVSEDEGKSWRIHDDRVIGRDAAYEMMDELKKKHPLLTWRVYRRNIADTLMYGIRLGKSLCNRCEFKPRHPDKRKKDCKVVN